MSVRHLSILFCLLSLCLLPLNALAAQPAAGTSNPAAETDSAKQLATKAAMKADATPIAVTHEGTDTLGAMLATQLREGFNTGTLFALNDKNVPKLHLLISTTAEFPSRPGVGSVYTAVWLYSERANVLSSYLAHETGIITPQNVQELAAALSSRTAGLAAKHAYVFGK